MKPVSSCGASQPAPLQWLRIDRAHPLERGVVGAIRCFVSFLLAVHFAPPRFASRNRTFFFTVAPILSDGLAD